MSETFEMVVKALHRLGKILAKELLASGANDLQIGRRMVSFAGDKELLYKVGLHCRTALRILKPIYHFKAKDADTVYKEAEKVKWEKYLSLNKTFAIGSVIYSEDFSHSKFVTCRTKDAIVDYFIEKFRKRPSVRVNNPDSYINIYISHSDCTLSIGSFGESLCKCGYRVDRTEAPSNKVLAAGIILKTGWKGESNFVDPVCSSDILLIEAAMITLNIVLDIHRKGFAFQKWVGYDGRLFDRIHNDESGKHEFASHCYGSDISQVAVDIVLENTRSASLMKYVDLKVKPFQQYIETPKPDMLVTNPPYGERISPRDLLGLYNMINERLKHVFMGYKAWILNYKDECLDKIGLRPSEKVKLMSGSLECEHRCYELFEEANKGLKKALNEDGEEYLHRSEGSFGRRGSDHSNFRTGRVDRLERRFTAAHSEDDKGRFALILEKRIFGGDRGEDRPVRKKSVDAPVRKLIKPKGERPVKMRCRNEDDRKEGFGDHKQDGKRPLNELTRLIKRRGHDDYED